MEAIVLSNGEFIVRMKINHLSRIAADVVARCTARMYFTGYAYRNNFQDNNDIRYNGSVICFVMARVHLLMGISHCFVI